MPNYQKEVQELLQDAWNLYRKAIEEKDKDLRNAAEKAWCAVVQAARALCLEYTGELPKKTPELTKCLDTLTKKYREIRELGIDDRYHARADSLHGSCFYQSLCDPEVHGEEIEEKVKRFIEDVEKLIEMHRQKYST